MSRVNVLGVSIDNFRMPEVLDRIAGFVEQHEFAYAVTPNVDHIIKIRSDPEFREIYENAQLVLADGVPLLWASRALGDPLQERINGTDLFELTCALAARRGYSIYLLGGNPGTARNACAKLSMRFPGLQIAGWECPPYGFGANVSDNLKVQEKILKSGADILFVGLGAPKQDKWIFSYGRGAGVAFAVGVGCSFSFVAGEIRRAPLWMQRRGLEWLSRLFSEPKRLWRRYLLQDPVFFGLLFVQSVKIALRRFIQRCAGCLAD